MGCANHGIAFPVTYLGLVLNMGWVVANGPSVRNLASAFPATGIALLAFLLTAQLLIESSRHQLDQHAYGGRWSHG